LTGEEWERPGLKTVNPGGMRIFLFLGEKKILLLVRDIPRPRGGERWQQNRRISGL